MKSLMSGIFFSLFMYVAQAQNFSGGIMGGFSLGPVKIDEINNDFTDNLEGENVMGYEASVFTRLGLAAFYIKPMVTYSVRSGKVRYIQNNVFNGTGSNEHIVDFSAEKLEVPLLLGLHVLGPFLSIEGGPVYNYIINITERYNENEINFSKSGIGYRAGIASELGPVYLSAGYQRTTAFGEQEKANFSEPYKLIFCFGVFIW